MLCLNAKCRQEVSDDFVFCPWCGKKLHPPEKKTKSRGNGLGTVYKLPNGKWCAEKTLGWLMDPLPENAPPGTVPHKRRVSVKRSYSTRKEAMAALPYLTASDVHPRSGSLTQRKGTAISLKELYDQWFPTHDRSDVTMRGYQTCFRVFSPLWHVKMEEITVEDLQDCMDDSDAGRRTLELARTALGLVYKYGIPRDAVPKDRNLASFLKIREPGSKKKSGFSPAELEKIRKAAADGDVIARMVCCHCYLGFRPTALLDLKAADYNEKEKAFVGGIKTEAGKNRTVTVSPKIQSYVDDFRAAAGDGYIFGQAGRQMPGHKYRELFYELLDRLEISNPVDEDGRHRLTPHSCRHTFATLMKGVKGPDTDKLALIGHTSTDQLRDYQDVRYEDLRAITDNL